MIRRILPKRSVRALLSGVSLFAWGAVPASAQVSGQQQCEKILRNGQERTVQVEKVGNQYQPVLVNGQMVDCALSPGVEPLAGGMVYVVVGGVVVGAIAAAVVAASGSRGNRAYIPISP